MRIASLCFALVIAGCAGTSKAPGSKPVDEPTDEPDAAALSAKMDAATSTPTGGSTGTGGDIGTGGSDEPADASAGGTGGTTVADASTAGSDAPPSTGGTMIPGCTLRWSPSAMRDGEKAFEAAEMPDVQFPGGSPGTHPGVKHLTEVADHDAYRIDSHYNPPNAVDYDRVTQTGPMRTDRLRCETRGMVDSAGKQVELHNGETWRLTWSLYIPATLKGTGRFTHIMQMKYVDKSGGASGSPIVTVTLRPGDTVEVLFWIGGGSIITTNISALHDRWLSADMTMKIGTAGSVHWVLKDGDKVVADKTQNGTTWPIDGDRLRPKWGIYRGITTGVETTYIMLSDMRAYQCQ
jgi:chitin-binding protein